LSDTRLQCHDDIVMEMTADGAVRLDDKAGAPVALLSSEAAWQFVTWWTDGCCPQCGEAIPLGHLMCEDCTRQAMWRWDIREAR